MSLIVQKFGGSSVRDAQRIRNVAGIIAETYLEGNDVLVVLSAQGDTTDDLIAKAEEINSHPSKREMDMLLATGEQISVALCAMALESMGLPCVSLTAWQVGIQTTAVHGDARIKRIDSERVQAELDQHRIVLITGFQGMDRAGDVTTLGRGGSDTSAVALAAVSAGCFAIEAVYMGYIPLLLRGVPHAYSYFHVTGLHYLTVSCVLVPALSVIYFCIEGGRSRGRLVCMLLADAAAVAIPLLCVSRSQLLFAVLLALITYMQMEHQLNPIYVVFALAGLIMLYILLTIARSHDTAYLNTVFEMKRHLPIFVTQPYIYVANNYDNFDCLVKGLVKHSWGMKMLAPFWTLTGLKFLVPSLTAFPYYVTKEELTTLTMFYDAYYDFGVIGVFVFSALLGAAAYLLMRMMRQVQNPITYLLYAQFALYMLLSFFTTWFSNPSTWFYFAVTAVVAFLVSHKIAGR